MEWWHLGGPGRPVGLPKKWGGLGISCGEKSMSKHMEKQCSGRGTKGITLGGQAEGVWLKRHGGLNATSTRLDLICEG